MKIISFAKKKNRELWLILSLLVAGFLGWKVFTPPNDYPTSDVVINPVTGKYDPQLESWVVPITSPSLDDDTVVIDLEDRGGVANSIGADVLFVLSPVIRMHPKTKKFIVTWQMTGGLSSGNDRFELIYRRDTKKVFYHAVWFFQGKDLDKTDLIASNIKDSDIHNTIANHRPYTDLGK